MRDIQRIADILDGKPEQPTEKGAPTRKQPERRRVTPAESAQDEGAVDPLDEIDALTRDDDIEGDDDAAAESGAAAGAESGTLKALAEKLNIDVAELYKVRIPMGGDVSMTLGELKDVGKRSTDIDAAQLAFDDAVTKQRTEYAAARDELANIVHMLPPQALSPQLIEAARSAGEKYQAEQGRLLGELVPEWKDAKVYAEDRVAILEHVKASGWTAADLDGLHDARLLAYFRKQARREQRVNELLARLKSNPSSRGFKQNAKGRKAAESARARQTAATGSRAEKTKAIESILRGE